MTANSVLFISNVISCHLVRHQMCWTILNCFTNETKGKNFKQALRLLERELENVSLYDV